jgi:hypothetical protein
MALCGIDRCEGEDVKLGRLLTGPSIFSRSGHSPKSVHPNFMSASAFQRSFHIVRIRVVSSPVAACSGLDAFRSPRSSNSNSSVAAISHVLSGQCICPSRVDGCQMNTCGVPRPADSSRFRGTRLEQHKVCSLGFRQSPAHSLETNVDLVDERSSR